MQKAQSNQVLRALIPITLLQSLLLLIALVLIGANGWQVEAGASSLLGINTWLNWAVLVLSAVWIYALHVDLKQIWLDYPISSMQALKHAFIPIYNLQGYWAMWEQVEYRLLQPERSYLPRIKVLILIKYYLVAMELWHAAALPGLDVSVDRHALIGTGIWLAEYTWRLLLYRTVSSRLERAAIAA